MELQLLLLSQQTFAMSYCPFEQPNLLSLSLFLLLSILRLLSVFSTTSYAIFPEENFCEHLTSDSLRFWNSAILSAWGFRNPCSCLSTERSNVFNCFTLVQQNQNTFIGSQSSGQRTEELVDCPCLWGGGLNGFSRGLLQYPSDCLYLSSPLDHKC